MLKNLEFYIKCCLCVFLIFLLSFSTRNQFFLENEYFFVPKNFPNPNYKIKDNPITKDGFELGKSLFFDGILSRDGSISCAECHIQEYAFTHHTHPFSHGIDGIVSLRNAPAIQNMAWSKNFMHDGGTLHLDFVPINAIENPIEMDEKVKHILEKLQKTSKYPEMFEKVFGTKIISTSNFLKALSQYTASLISANSRYDKFVRKEGEVFSKDELAGLKLFKEKCANCHAGDLFTDHKFRNNGLPFQERKEWKLYKSDTANTVELIKVEDFGRMRITESEKDRNLFKVPSLRNIEVTTPYMHDGRFKTLKEVLNHYSNGVAKTQNLDILLNKSGKLGIPLNDLQKVQIIAFLKTLTDKQFLKDPRFTPPNFYVHTH